MNKKPAISNLRRQLGQGMTEYIIIVALVAVAATGAYSMFGEVVQNQTAAIAAELAGGDGSAASQQAADAADAAISNAAKVTNLSNYAAGNNASIGGGSGSTK